MKQITCRGDLEEYVNAKANFSAAKAYAKAIGKPVEELETFFMYNPIGLVAEG
ncbi:hypothetical protein GJ688_17275 [Heliobacillus mobilis]|uniref:Uncharacterized protein n=1 Tax=Heliobacterium mobile TaxID=28064 RepID=A0A6I3SNT1_HELMO|nr:hypothetical protein [Heliobacterium mobile]